MVEYAVRMMTKAISSAIELSALRTTSMVIGSISEADIS